MIAARKPFLINKMAHGFVRHPCSSHPPSDNRVSDLFELGKLVTIHLLFLILPFFVQPVFRLFQNVNESRARLCKILRINKMTDINIKIIRRQFIVVVGNSSQNLLKRERLKPFRFMRCPSKPVLIGNMCFKPYRSK